VHSLQQQVGVDTVEGMRKKDAIRRDALLQEGNNPLARLLFQLKGTLTSMAAVRCVWRAFCSHAATVLSLLCFVCREAAELYPNPPM